jgi:glycosyltransferase involved in cell wall biosynthesis
MLDPYFQTAPGRKIKAIRNWVFWKLVERKIIHDASGLLFTCEMEKILARRTFKPYQPKTELVVGLGVDAPPMYTTAMSDVFTSKSGLEKNRPYLLYISRIHEKKGIDLLVTSYLNLEQEKIPLPALVIAGPGRETAYGEKIQLIASKSQNIVFTGMLAGAAKWGAFYGCQAFILPSHQENFGIAVVEAMTCGKPVLISNQINIWKEIIDFGAGLVAQDTEAGCRELLEKWMALLPEEKEQMGECAKLCYQKKFSIHAASQHLLQAVSSH